MAREEPMEVVLSAVNLDPRKLLGFRLTAMSSGSATGAKIGGKPAIKAGAKAGTKIGAKGGGTNT